MKLAIAGGDIGLLTLVRVLRQTDGKVSIEQICLLQLTNSRRLTTREGFTRGSNITRYTQPANFCSKLVVKIPIWPLRVRLQQQALQSTDKAAWQASRKCLAQDMRRRTPLD